MAIRTNRRRSPRGRVRAPREPRAAEAAYIRDLTRIWSIAEDISMIAIEPLLEAWPQRSDSWVLEHIGRIRETKAALRGRISGAMARMEARLSALAAPTPSSVTITSIDDQVGWARRRIREVLDKADLEVIVGSHALSLDRSVVRDLTSILSIDLEREIPSLVGALDQWAAANVALIESGTSAPIDGRSLKSVLGYVEDEVRQAHRNGLRVEELRSRLVDRFSVSRSRAQLIARDQILTLNSQIHRQRQKAVGVTEYTWITSRDERVRSEHQRRHGKVFSWDAPPSDGHPGEPIQCRCVARPKFSDSDQFGSIPQI